MGLIRRIFGFLDGSFSSSSSKDCAIHFLSEVRHPDLAFKLKNGTELRGLCDLAEALEEMDEATFIKHANRKRNDFSQWVREIIGDYRLAGKLEELDSREEFNKAVNVRVNYFKRMLR